MNILQIKGVRTIALACVAAVAGLGIGVALASQPQMEGALSALQSAEANLDHVTLDKGGHAAKARRLVADAMSQVKAGIEYGNAHGY